MVYVTGDTHGQFARIEEFCKRKNTSKDDALVILGDAGINYYCNTRDALSKEYLSALPITLLCIHGNHEKRPQNIKGYELSEFCGGNVYVQKEYPNILFAQDGEMFELNGKQCVVCGGAYSVDKYYRLEMGAKWWADEQPDYITRVGVELSLDCLGYKVDYFLTHTCPYKYIPTEMFLQGIDQSKVDNSTEEWLDTIEQKTQYEKWYCGHYHTDKTIDKIHFLFEEFCILGQE